MGLDGALWRDSSHGGGWRRLAAHPFRAPRRAQRVWQSPTPCRCATHILTGLAALRLCIPAVRALAVVRPLVFPTKTPPSPITPRSPEPLGDAAGDVAPALWCADFGLGNFLNLEGYSA
jgi:hypothetical protein